MMETTIHKAGKELNQDARNISTEYRKAHNGAVFDIYTPHIHAAHSTYATTSLPDAYGRGRTTGDYRGITLYGVDRLIEFRQTDKVVADDAPFSEHWVRFREEHAEQIKALKKLKIMATSYGFDTSDPARNVKEVVQWTYLGYLTSVKPQDDTAVNIGRLPAFFDHYFQHSLDTSLITEEDARGITDALVIKLRIVRFLRTIEYDQIFPGDPCWATRSGVGIGEDSRSLVTKTSFRLLRTSRSLGPVPKPNIVIFWGLKPPEGYKEFCATISIGILSVQCEADKQIHSHWGDDAAIAYRVSSMRVGGQMQFPGARMNAIETLLYVINGGHNEMSGKLIVLDYEGVVDNSPLDFDDVWMRYEKVLDWVAATYVEALNIIHYCHDRYAYESIEMALHDSDIVHILGCDIVGLSIVAGSLLAIKYAKVTPMRDETGPVVDYIAEGDFPIYGSGDGRIDEVTTAIVHTVMGKIKETPLYRSTISTQSVLTIISSVVYGEATGSFPSGHKVGAPFTPGTNPEDGVGNHGMLAPMLSVGKLDYSDALDNISLTSTTTPSGFGRTKEEQINNLVGILGAGFVPNDCCC